MQAVRDGLDLEEIANTHGRTIGAIRARLVLMAPDDELNPASKKARIASLREHLTTGDYDWRSHLYSRVSHAGWTPAEDALLREGWEARTLLVELADAMRRSEPLVVRRLVQIRLAKNLLEVVDQMGCEPNGAVAINPKLARGAVAPIFYVLLGVDERGRPIHLSVHESAQAAKDLSMASQEGGDTVTRWQTVARQVGGPGYTNPLAGYNLRSALGSTD